VAVHESDGVVREVARKLVTELAPEELPLFRPIADAYFRDASWTLDQRHQGDELLGFGVNEAVVLITPVVLAVVHDIVVHLTARLADQLAKEGGDVVRGWLQRLFGESERPAGATVPALSQAQLAEVRQRAYDTALSHGLKAEKASLVADSLTAGLATQAAT